MAHSDAILAAVDGSSSALGAARWAALEAGLRRRPLIIGSAAPAEAVLAQALGVARAVLPAGHDVTTQMWEGPPIPALLERSESVGVIVLGHRGLGDSPVLGSVTESVAAQGHCPVVVVREWSGSEERFGDGPVVVGVDGSADSEAAIARAMAEASVRGVEVIAVHAWTDVAPDAALAEALAGWQERYPDVRVERVVVKDRPVRRLLAQADAAQLLIVGRRGSGGFEGMTAGSTSRALMQTAPCPLMIVKPE